MQGRLLPKVNNRFQAFPVSNWQNEFFLSKELGLDLIEFIFDKGDINISPLMNEKGMLEIQKIINKSKIKIKSVCADYFMFNPFYEINEFNNIDILKTLISNCSLLNISDIVIPCVDNSSLNSKNKINDFIKNINQVKEHAREKNINLAIESDLEPKKFINLINLINSKNITINYDTGNSAYKGFDSSFELQLFQNKITSFHIKDRLFNGDSVPLGSGDFKFVKFFKDLKKFNIKPSYFIIQAYRNEEGIEIFKKQYNWLVNQFKSYFQDNI